MLHLWYAFKHNQNKQHRFKMGLCFPEHRVFNLEEVPINIQLKGKFTMHASLIMIAVNSPWKITTIRP